VVAGDVHAGARKPLDPRCVRCCLGQRGAGPQQDHPPQPPHPHAHRPRTRASQELFQLLRAAMRTQREDLTARRAPRFERSGSNLCRSTKRQAGVRTDPNSNGAGPPTIVGEANRLTRHREVLPRVAETSQSAQHARSGRAGGDLGEMFRTSWGAWLRAPPRAHHDEEALRDKAFRARLGCTIRCSSARIRDMGWWPGHLR
jgi:hypothetical protein